MAFHQKEKKIQFVAVDLSVILKVYKPPINYLKPNGWRKNKYNINIWSQCNRYLRCDKTG